MAVEVVTVVAESRYIHRAEVALEAFELIDEKWNRLDGGMYMQYSYFAHPL